MPKIALRYVGNDERMKRRLASTDGIQYFEPVDAQEVLATPGQKDYEIVEEQRKLFGMQYESRPGYGNPDRVSIPSLQGADNELQTGLTVEQYRRDQVVKAIPDGATPTAARPMTTMGRPLNLDDAQSGKYAGSGDPRHGMQQEDQRNQGGSDDGRPRASDGMTVDEMKDALRARNVQFPSDAKKAELAELVDRHNARKA